MRRVLLLTAALFACQPTSSSDSARLADSLPTRPPTPVVNTPQPSASPLFKLARLKLKDTIIPCELVDTPAARTQGLSGRASLQEGHGLILAFETPQVTRIWMPDMNFAIDVFFVKNNRIVALYQDVPPCPSRDECPSFGPAEPIDYVLEVNAGSARHWQAAVGDSIVRLE